MGRFFMGRVSIILLMMIMCVHHLFIVDSIYSNEMSIPKDNITISDIGKCITYTDDTNDINKNLTPMEALDLIQEEYASNFIKISLQENQEDYFYKLDFAEYYLVYEGVEDDTGYYLIHLYEFVLDEEDTGIGHTVTYGWYRVNPCSGEIIIYPE